ncbi:MAG: hypothetical protein CMJ16_09575 [Peredibacter sp.]|nr:hypothetical protein [Peredibacter sp.]
MYKVLIFLIALVSLGASATVSITDLRVGEAIDIPGPTGKWSKYHSFQSFWDTDEAFRILTHNFEIADENGSQVFWVPNNSNYINLQSGIVVGTDMDSYGHSAWVNNVYNQSFKLINLKGSKDKLSVMEEKSDTYLVYSTGGKECKVKYILLHSSNTDQISSKVELPHCINNSKLERILPFKKQNKIFAFIETSGRSASSSVYSSFYYLVDFSSRKTLNYIKNESLLNFPKRIESFNGEEGLFFIDKAKRFKDLSSEFDQFDRRKIIGFFRFSDFRFEIIKDFSGRPTAPQNAVESFQYNNDTYLAVPPNSVLNLATKAVTRLNFKFWDQSERGPNDQLFLRGKSSEGDSLLYNASEGSVVYQDSPSIDLGFIYPAFYGDKIFITGKNKVLRVR